MIASWKKGFWAKPALAAVLWVVVASRAWPADVVISEFMAINNNTLIDVDGDYSDWIELYNTSSSTVSLADWYLTDDPADLDQWQFPAVSLLSGEYLIVFASDKDRRVVGQELHTNFKLSGSGDYLALVRPNGVTVEFEYTPAFPEQFSDMSYGLQPLTTSTTLVAAAQTANYLVPPNGNLGLTWTAEGFDDTSWTNGPTGIGFEKSGDDYDDLIQTRLADVVAGVYTRFTFSTPVAGGDILSLSVKYDDGFVAYLNGVEVASTNAPLYPAYDSLATAAHPNSSAVVYEEFDISDQASLVHAGTNVLAVHIMGADLSARTADMLILPELQVLRYLLGVTDEQRYFHMATPGAANTVGYEGISGAVQFSKPAGFYTNAISLELSAAEGGIIRYTLDGSDPTASSPVYATPLPVASRVGDPNVYSEIRTQGARYSWQPPWYPPAGEVFKATVVRAQAFEPGQAPGPICTQTYFVDTNILNRYPTIPVISLTSDPSNLFDNATGIYVPGNTFTGGAGTGNYYQDWERRTHLEFWDANRTDHFEQDVGIKIQGATSPSNPHKGLHVIARSEYGKKRLEYPLFGSLDSRAGKQNSFKHILLRGWGSYRGRALLYDPFAQMLFEHTDMDIQSYRLCVVFINGEYWGLHEMREANQNSWYHEENYGIDRDDPGYDLIDGYGQIDEGDLVHWQATMSYINTVDLTVPANYAHVKTLVDVENLILYIVHSCFVNHGDWPNQNEGKWRPRTPDGRWRWTPFDFDHSFHDSWNADMIARAKSSQSPFSRLITNADFRRDFVNCYADHLNTSFRVPVMVERFAKMVAEMNPYMPEFADRWSLNYDWATWLAGMSNNIVMRESFERPNLMSEFGILASTTVTLDVSPLEGGTIQINTIEIDEDTPGVGSPHYPWERGYFRDVPIDLTAIPKKGFRFAEWSGSVTGDVGAVTAPMSESTMTATASFVPFHPSEYPVVVSEIMYRPAEGSTNYPDADDYEFIELVNNGSASVDLLGATFTKGLDFTFTNSLLLGPSQHAVIVKNQDAFAERYGTAGILIAGEFGGSLDNGGENIALRAASWGPVLASFAYGDGREWPKTADGAGHSLVPELLADQVSGGLNYGGNWRASTYRFGSPGAADPTPIRNVVLNEVMAHTDYTNAAKPEYDSNDWIELFNASATSHSLQHWYLSDSQSYLKKWQIPGTNVIAAGDWVAFDEVTGFHSPITNGFGLNKLGETLYLSHLPGTTEDRVADCLRFKAQENEISLGRYPDGSGYWRMLAPTFAAENSLPRIDVVIREIMYHPVPTLEHPEDNVADEYVEIYNPRSETIPLAAESGQWRLTGEVDFMFPSNAVLSPRSYAIVLPFDPANTLAMDGFTNVYGELPQGALVFGPYAGRLSNEGGRLALERPVAPDLPGENSGWAIVDEVFYFDQSPWPSAADGTGGSLLRAQPSGAGMAPEEWLLEQPPTPGGPPPKVIIVTPRAGEDFVLPLSVTVVVSVDEDQVTGSIHSVELLCGSNTVGTVTAAPFTFLLDSAAIGIGEGGTATLVAKITDDIGVTDSAPTVLDLLRIENTGAANLTETTANLTGSLEGQGEAVVTVYWGESNGGTEPSSWFGVLGLGSRQPGPLTVPLENLVLGRTYYYRYHAATDRNEGWASESAEFTLSFDGWTNWMKISFPAYTRGSALTNFPALIKLEESITDFRYDGFTSPEGEDLRFLNAEKTTSLMYEFEQWNTGGVSLVWVQVPELSGPADYIWACWGNPQATSLPFWATNGATWDESFAAVWHFGDTLVDASPDRLVATNYGTVATSGAIAGARQFDGVDDWIDPGVPTDWYEQNIQGLTVSFWVRPEGDAGETPLGSQYGRGKPFRIARGAGQWEFIVEVTNSEHTVNQAAWQMLTLVLDNGQAHAYKNGQFPSVVLTPPSFTPDPEPWIGTYNGHPEAMYFYTGAMDEFRFSSVARSADWVWAEYMTVAGNDTFTTYNVQSGEGPDSDNDGLPDAWEYKHFENPWDPDAEPDADPDGDSFENWREYVAGTDPTNGLEFFQVTLYPEADEMCVKFFAVAADTNYDQTVRLHSLESATSLLNVTTWEGVAGYTNLPGSNQWILYTDPATSAVPFHYRGRAWLPTSP